MKRYYSDYNRIMSLIYEDQPISPQADREVVFIPERIKSIRSMGRGVSAWRQPREVIFLHQAKVMADYEDDYEYTRDIPAYQPTYESLTDEQLRGYFGFRTRIRKGHYKKGPAAYAYLYMYELINLIGVESPIAGFYRLSVFADRYGQLNPSILPYAEQWLIDYVLYYGLDPELLQDRKAVEYDKKLAVLLNAAALKNEKNWPEYRTQNRFRGRLSTENYDNHREIFEAMLWISGLDRDVVLAFQWNPELFERAAVKSFQEMSAYYDSHRKQSLMEDYVGEQINQLAKLFGGAVFHDGKKTNTRGKCFESTRASLESKHYFAAPIGAANERRWVNELMRSEPASGVRDIRLSELTTYHFENGVWSVKTYPRDFRNRHFAELLRTVDSVILEEAGNGEAVLAGIQTKWVRKLIRKTVEEAGLEIQQEKARRIEIDFSSLDHIRSDATNTMEKLITEDDLDLVDDFFGETREEEKTAESIKVAQNSDERLTDMRGEFPIGLSVEEYDLVMCLLNNGNPIGLDLNGKFMSVIVDSINEKLFDEIGDVVIEDGNPPRLVEDYLDELEELLCKN